MQHEGCCISHVTSVELEGDDVTLFNLPQSSLQFSTRNYVSALCGRLAVEFRDTRNSHDPHMWILLTRGSLQSRRSRSWHERHDDDLEAPGHVSHVDTFFKRYQPDNFTSINPTNCKDWPTLQSRHQRIQAQPPPGKYYTSYSTSSAT